MKFNLTRWASVPLLLVVGCVTTTKQNTESMVPGMSKGPGEVKPDAPINVNTRIAAGALAEQQGDLPRAVIQYTEALKVEPNAELPLLRLGLIYVSLKQYDDALKIWPRYIKATKNSAAAYCDFALTLELANRNADAESAYKTAIAKDARNEPVRVNYGLMLARQGRLEDSLTQLQVALTPAEAHYDIASVLEGQGKLEAAKSQYEQALKMDPEMNDAKSRLAGLDMTNLD